MPSKPLPPQDVIAELAFPVAGIDSSAEYELQAQQTTLDAENVRAFDPLALRARGGSRPGLVKWITTRPETQQEAL